jgi:hypothetical protein
MARPAFITYQGRTASATRLWTPAVVVELLAIARLAGIEALAVTRPAAVVTLLEVAAGFVRVGGVTRALKVVAAVVDLTFRWAIRHCDLSG